MDQALLVLVLVLVGILSGFLNTLASGGSIITLPVLIFLGVPAPVANGTNRLPIVAGSLTAVASFARGGVIVWRESLLLAVPTVAGAAIGAAIASYLSVQATVMVVVFVTILSLFVLFSNPKKILINPPERDLRVTNTGVLLFFLIGIWAGFIIIDTATFLLLALILAAGFSFVEANATKSLLLLGISAVSLAIFAVRGEVNLVYGLVICAGSIAGSYLASLIATKEWVRIWVYYILIAMVVLELLHFLQLYW